MCKTIEYQKVLAAYKGRKEHNSVIYDLLSTELDQENNDTFRHRIRACQEYLASQGLLLNVGYAIWQPI
jgi:hypothetical protein